mmetsp:Transcript_5486/g.6689  ORF Transcript_5486/g.6689 Transcript_5486/m.6689 type:complete len:248 (+) Transcript_5486:35-778(+)
MHLVFNVSLTLAHKFGFLFSGLESSVSKFTCSINKFECNFFGRVSASLSQKSLSESDNTFNRTNNGTTDHDPIVFDDTIMRETSHRCDFLLGQIKFSRSMSVSNDVSFIVFNNGSFSGELWSSDFVDLLVDLSTMMVTILTSTWDRVLDSTWMPSSNTSNLTETLVSLSWKTRSSPTGGDSFKTFTLGNTNNIDHLILGENLGNWDRLFEKRNSIVNLSSNITSIDLNFHQVSLLLSKWQLSNIRVN